MTRRSNGATMKGMAGEHEHHPERLDAAPARVVVHVGGLRFATETAAVERAIGRQPGVVEVQANPSAQTATVTYDPARKSVAALQRWVEECGYHCAGQSVPLHVCEPLVEPVPEEAMGHGGHGQFHLAEFLPALAAEAGHDRQRQRFTTPWRGDAKSEVTTLRPQAVTLWATEVEVTASWKKPAPSTLRPPLLIRVSSKSSVSRGPGSQRWTR